VIAATLLSFAASGLGFRAGRPFSVAVLDPLLVMLLGTVKLAAGFDRRMLCHCPAATSPTTAPVDGICRVPGTTDNRAITEGGFVAVRAGGAGGSLCPIGFPDKSRLNLGGCDGLAPAMREYSAARASAEGAPLESNGTLLLCSPCHGPRGVCGPEVLPEEGLIAQHSRVEDHSDRL